MKEVVEISPTGQIRAKLNNFKILGGPMEKIEKARWVAATMHALDTISAAATKELKEYIKEIGMEVSIPGVSFNFKVTESVDWDRVNKKMKGMVCEIFDQHHIDPKRFMVFSATSTKGIDLLEDQKFLQKLTLALPREVTTRFTTSKT
jgi:hypothetical protein